MSSGFISSDHSTGLSQSHVAGDTATNSSLRVKIEIVKLPSENHFLGAIPLSVRGEDIDLISQKLRTLI